MGKLKSYTNIFNVEKVFYAINDVQLPFPVTLTQMAWFVFSFLFVMIFANVPPLLFIDSVLLKHVGLPTLTAWFMSQKVLDGKKPHRYMITYIMFLFRPKTTFGEKAVRLKKQKLIGAITAVRSEKYVSH